MRKIKVLGVIRTQTIRGTLFTYIGAGLGLVTNIFLFAEFFSPEQIGLLNLIVAYSLIFAQIANLGFDNVTIRLFPYFRNDANKHNGYLFIMLSVLIVGSIISTIFYFILQPFILDTSERGADLFSQYAFYIVPLILFTLLLILFMRIRVSFIKV